MTLYFLLIMNPVKAKCKHCGKDAASDQFRLHYQLRMMVCPACYSGKPTPAQQAAREVVNPSHPPGWDKEDEYLEKTQRARMKETVIVRKVGDSRVKYKCPKCNYQFLYDMDKKTPTVCPYCSSNIYKIRFE